MLTSPGETAQEQEISGESVISWQRSLQVSKDGGHVQNSSVVDASAPTMCLLSSPIFSVSATALIFKERFEDSCVT
jgi:hypothetical protein